MTDTNPELEQASVAQVEQSRDSQSTSSPRQQSSSPQPSSPTSTTNTLPSKAPAQSSAEDTTSRRKREREGSLEPSQLTPSKATEANPAKKNRVEDSLQEEDDDDAPSHPVETDKVGHIRKKVDELSTKELELKTAGNASDAAVAEREQDAASSALAQPAPATDPKPQFATSSAQEKTAEPQASKATQDPPVRTQPTFSSFSSKSSPFSSVPSSSGSSSASATKTGFSAFAAKSSGIKPSSLGSSIGGHHDENGSASPLAGTAASAAQSSKPIVKGSSFGFGAFAGASPLAKPKAASPAATEKQAEKPESTDDKASFTEKLLSQNDDASAASESKSKPLLEATETETKTGEEDEKSIHSIRAKLYTMAPDQSWKERGTGTLRVNVPKLSSDKRPARLVMRADGILRVILNVPLFKGMKCELHEKFVRIVALEDTKPVHYAIKLSNPNNAAALMDVLDEFVVSADQFSQA
ncbi:related to YRB2-Ran-GTPase-binding protein involved in nuclear protein export [Sporisorium reilianum SRZ2]|uniref:Related to YRB2-Ran-GTPase-binding protein involved in nuclear protein export n=1 Tax=Sporisorium reilianum (strain SRZ2) TaxID=999809 RepID=E6ZMW1_SPORE|nr:related to YRB2-Ran-GTPase-binding protein involved in nuclear protein export [Sporisorium reilianum SRZ2]